MISAYLGSAKLALRNSNRVGDWTSASCRSVMWTRQSSARPGRARTRAGARPPRSRRGGRAARPRRSRWPGTQLTAVAQHRPVPEPAVNGQRRKAPAHASSPAGGPGPSRPTAAPDRGGWTARQTRPRTRWPGRSRPGARPVKAGADLGCSQPRPCSLASDGLRPVRRQIVCSVSELGRAEERGSPGGRGQLGRRGLVDGTIGLHRGLLHRPEPPPSSQRFCPPEAACE